MLRFPRVPAINRRSSRDGYLPACQTTLKSNARRVLSGGPQTFRGFGIKAGRQLKPILPASDARWHHRTVDGAKTDYSGPRASPATAGFPIVIFKSGTVRRTGNRTFENCPISWVPTCPLGVSQAAINADQKLIKKRSETDRPKPTPPKNPAPKMMFASSGPLTVRRPFGPSWRQGIEWISTSSPPGLRIAIAP
jgi:hypothetical protein